MTVSMLVHQARRAGSAQYSPIILHQAGQARNFLLWEGDLMAHGLRQGSVTLSLVYQEKLIMNPKPIGPTAHGAIDYGFAALNALAPTLFGLTGPAKAICYGFAASQGLLNTFTDHPLGWKKVVPLRLHGELETTFVPSILLLPLMTGAFRQRNAQLYFSAFFALAAANYVLSDFNAYEPLAPLPSGQRAVAWVEAEVD